MKILEVLKKVAIEFCTESSLHGVQYIVEPKRALIERLFWKLVIFFACIATLICLYNFYWFKFTQLQVVTSILATSYPSFVLEQPALTICSSNKLFKSSADQFFRMMNFDDELEKEQLERSLPRFIKYMYMKDSKMMFHEMHMLMKWTDYLQKHDWTMSKFMLYLHQPCSEMIVRCHFGGKSVDCLDVFRVSRTGEGFCCSYDYIQNNDALLYSFNPPPNPIKLHKSVIQYGYEDGITLLLNLTSQGSTYTNFYENSALVFVHSPKDYPSFHSVGIFISGGTEIFYRFKLTAMFGSPNLRALDPSVRQCYVNGEVKLKYFDHYTLNNCALESDMELLLSECNCLTTFYPNPGIYKDCTIFNDFCVDNILYKFISHNIMRFVQIDGKSIPCLERCSYVRYTPSISHGDFDGQQFNAYGYWDGITNLTGLSTLRIFQPSSEATVYQKTVQDEQWQILVTIGGVAGVVFGLDLFSIVQFIYFFTFRFYYYMRHQFKSQSINEQCETNRNAEQRPLKIFVTNHHDMSDTTQ